MTIKSYEDGLSVGKNKAKQATKRAKAKGKLRKKVYHQGEEKPK